MELMNILIHILTRKLLMLHKIKPIIYSLETILKKKKDKYTPFYEKIGMQMPENLVSITADKLCRLLGVENLHIIDSIDGKTSPSLESNSGCTAEMIISAIIIFAMIMITIIATTS